MLYSFSLVLRESRDFQMQLSDFCIALRVRPQVNVKVRDQLLFGTICHLDGYKFNKFLYKYSLVFMVNKNVDFGFCKFYGDYRLPFTTLSTPEVSKAALAKINYSLEASFAASHTLRRPREAAYGARGSFELFPSSLKKYIKIL